MVLRISRAIKISSAFSISQSKVIHGWKKKLQLVGVSKNEMTMSSKLFLFDQWLSLQFQLVYYGCSDTQDKHMSLLKSKRDSVRKAHEAHFIQKAKPVEILV